MANLKMCEKELDGVIEAISETIDNMGYSHSKISELDGKLLITNIHDGIVFRDSTGVEYTIMFSINIDKSDCWREESTNFISKEKVFISRD